MHVELCFISANLLRKILRFLLINFDLKIYFSLDHKVSMKSVSDING